MSKQQSDLLWMVGAAVFALALWWLTDGNREAAVVVGTVLVVVGLGLVGIVLGIRWLVRQWASR